MAETWNYSDELFGGTMTPVQSAPAPATGWPRPGEGQSKPYSYSDELFNPKPVQAEPVKPADPNAEPDAASWLGRRWQDIRGKQDKRFADLPRISDLGVLDVTTENQAKLAMPNDAAYGDIIAKNLGERMTRRFQDANGYEIIGFRKPDGTEQLAYVNRPGLDTEDFGRAATGSLPFLAGGGVAGKVLSKVGAPIVGQVLGQAATALGISGGQDIAANQMGSEQGFDVPKAIGSAGGAALFQAAAPAAGYVWRKLVTEPGLIDKATGQLTQKGAIEAQKAGLDPSEWTADIAKRWAQEFAKSGDAKLAGVTAEIGDVGIPTTLGQRTKSIPQLRREQELRDGVFGDAKAAAMKQFDDEQLAAIERAAFKGPRSFAAKVAPDRTVGDYSPASVGEGIQTRAQAAQTSAAKQASAEWDKVGKLEATDQSFAALPDFINNELGTFSLTKDTTPYAANMLGKLEAFIEGKAPEQVSKLLRNNPTRDVNEMRKGLLKDYTNAQTKADKDASKAIYNAFNKWVDDSAGKQLLTASTPDAAVAAASMKTARGLTREMHDIFDGKPGGSGTILKKVLGGADSPEQVITQLFTAPTQKTVKPGSVAALRSLQQGADRFLPAEEAAALKGDLKLAYWLGIVRNPNGEVHNPQTLLKNLKVSLTSQRSVWDTLYSPAERAHAQRLVTALENGPTFRDWTVKPNSSRSGTTAAAIFTDLVGSFFGKNNAKTILQAGSRASGLSNSVYNKATSQELPTLIPPGFGPLGGALGGSTNN